VANKVEVEIAAKASGFDAEFKKISTAAARAGGQIKQSFGGIQSAAAALGLSLSGAGLGLFIKSTIDAADRLNDLSKITQVSAVTIGGIGFAAQQAGTDLDGTAKAFGKLNLLIADAQAGNEKALATFGKLGIGIRDLKTLKPEEIFAKTATAFSMFEDGANKVAGANAVFGKSFASVLPFLDEGGEKLQQNIEYYQRFSGVTQEVVNASDEFNDSLTKLGLLNKAFGNALVTLLLPPMQKFVDYLVEGKEQSGGFRDAASTVVDSLRLLATWATAAVLTFRDVGEIIGATAAQLGAIASLDFARVSAIGDDLDARLAKSRQTYEDFKKIINSTAATGGPKPVVGDAGRGRGRRPAPNFGDAGGAAGSATKKADEFAKALERVAKAAAEADLELAAMFSTQEITGAQKALNALASSDEWKQFTEAQRQDLTARYQAIDAIQRETAEWKKKREEQEKQIDVLKDLQAQQQQSVANFSAALGAYAEDNDFLARSISLIGEEDIARQKLAETMQFEALKRQALLADDDPDAAVKRIELLEQEYNERLKLIELIDQQTKRVQEVQQFSDIGAQSFSNFLQDLTKGKPLDALKNLAEEFTGRITGVVADNLSKQLFSKDGLLGGFGELFADLFGTTKDTGASALTGSATALTTSGTILSTAGASLSAAASALMAAAGLSTASNAADSFTRFLPGITDMVPPEFGIPAFALGTDYVQRTGLALVHQGERITNAAQNRRASGMRSRPNVTQVFNVAPRADTQSIRQAAKAGWRAGSGSARRG
jgi:hypothetical protein